MGITPKGCQSSRTLSNYQPTARTSTSVTACSSRTFRHFWGTITPSSPERDPGITFIQRTDDRGRLRGDLHHSIANACACVGFGPLESRRAWILGFIYSSSSQFMDSSFRICIPHARTYDKEAVFFVIVTCMRNTNSDSRVSYNSNNLASGLCFRVGAGRGLP